MISARISAATLLVLTVADTHLAAEPLRAHELAGQYASCASYYLMISKADPRLKKYAQIGVAAADNASRLSTPELALSLMAGETKRLLNLMEHDWGNAAAVIKNRAEPCKLLMTLP